MKHIGQDTKKKITKLVPWAKGDARCYLNITTSLNPHRKLLCNDKFQKQFVTQQEGQ